MNWKAFAVTDAGYIDPAIVALRSFRQHNPGIPITLYARTGGDYSRLKRALPEVEIREVRFPDLPIFSDVWNKYTELFYKPEAMPAFAARIKALEVLRVEAEYLINIDLDTLTLNQISPAVEMARKTGCIAAVSERENRTRWQNSLGITEIAEMPDYYNTGFAVYPSGIIPDDLFRRYCSFLRKFREQLYCPEQDFLNYTFPALIHPLPVSYNLMFSDPRYTTTAPRLIHYIGSDKPWTPGATFPGHSGHYVRRYWVECQRNRDALSESFLRTVSENAQSV